MAKSLHSELPTKRRSVCEGAALHRSVRGVRRGNAMTDRIVGNQSYGPTILNNNVFTALTEYVYDT